MHNKISRRDALVLLGAASALAAGEMLAENTAQAAKPEPSIPQEFPANPWWKPTKMDAMTAIRTRRSVRAFTGEDVTDEQVKEMLGAAMSAPSAGNEQPWAFVVVRDREILNKVPSINKFAGFIQKAALAIMVCGDLTLDAHHGYWIEDVSAASQNLLLAAHALGLGAVWTGVHPAEDREKGYRQLLGLPDNIVPLSFIIIGHPAKTPAPENRYQEARIHLNRW